MENNYSVPVTRVGFGYKNIDVVAPDWETAKTKALDIAGNFEFSEKSAEYIIDDELDVEPAKNEFIPILKPITFIGNLWHLFKVRYTAKRFDIHSKYVDPSNKVGYWIGYDNKLYYGKRWGHFFLSHCNDWWSRFGRPQL